VIRVLLLWLLVVNLLTYLVYWLDKRRARKGGRRVSENELLGWALVGGSPAAFWAMRKLRHKTQKTSFKLRFWGIVVLQVALVVVLLRPEL
jgi:uncharacterized membrane protein YsdA (DUF1294 family)